MVETVGIQTSLWQSLDSIHLTSLLVRCLVIRACRAGLVHPCEELVCCGLGRCSSLRLQAFPWSVGRESARRTRERRHKDGRMSCEMAMSVLGLSLDSCTYEIYQQRRHGRLAVPPTTCGEREGRHCRERDEEPRRTLRSRSRFKSQLGFLGWMLVRSC